jgi:hypothetical protein
MRLAGLMARTRLRRAVARIIWVISGRIELLGDSVRDPVEWIPLSRLCEIYAPASFAVSRAGTPVPGGSGRLPFARGAGRSAEVNLGCSAGLVWLTGLMVSEVLWRGSSGQSRVAIRPGVTQVAESRGFQDQLRPNGIASCGGKSVRKHPLTQITEVRVSGTRRTMNRRV